MELNKLIAKTCAVWILDLGVQFAVECALDVLIGGLAKGKQVGVETGKTKHWPNWNDVDEPYEGGYPLMLVCQKYPSALRAAILKNWAIIVNVKTKE